MTSTTITSDENSTFFDHHQTQEHHHQHHQHRSHANSTTLSRRNLHRSSSLPDVSSVTSQSQSQSQSHSHSRSGSITKTSASGSSTVSSLGNTYQSGSGPFGSFLRRHNTNSNSNNNIIVRQQQQRGLPANCNDDDVDSGHPPSDPSSSLDPPSLTSAMSPPPRGSDPAVPVRGSDPEGESDDLRSLSSMGTATFRRLRETRLASRREEKAKDSDENDDPRRRRRRRSRDDVAFDSRRENNSRGGGGNVTHRGGGVRRSPRRRRIYNERYDCDRDGDNGTVGGAIGDYDWGGDDRDDGGDGCGSSVSTEYTRNGSGATGGDSFVRDCGASRASSQSSSSSSRRHPSRDHAHSRSRSRSRHVPPSRSGSRGRNERLRPRGRPFDYDDDFAGDRFHRSRRGPTGYFRRVTATAFKTAVIFALGFLAMIRWELVDVDVARLLAGGGGTSSSSSSSSSSFRDVKTQIQKSFQDGERNLRGHSANRRDGTDDEDGNGVVGGDPRIRGNEWLHQQQLQRLQQLQLQQQLYLQQQSQSQSRYVGQSHLPLQSTQSRNPEDGNEQKEENEDEEADSGNGTDEDEDEDEDEDDDDDDASGREKLKNVDLHDSQDIKLYTGEIESVEETMDAKMEQDVVAEVPETDIETRKGVAGEPNIQEENTHVFEDFVDAVPPPHESVLLTKDEKEDEAGASSAVLHTEAENENEIMELGSEVEPEGVLDGMEGEKQQRDEETENEQTGQHSEQREESSTLDTDSIEELERLSQQSAESDLQWEVGEVNDNLVPNNIDANEIVTPQDSLAYLDKLFKLQQSDEELNYGDPQLEKQLPPPWQQQQQQQLNQHNLLDQLHEDLPVEESSQGGQLQNFQNTIHQFDQQQQESILLQQQQQQQRLDQQDLLDQLYEELPVEESSQGTQLHNIQNNIHQFDQQQQEYIMLQQQQQPQQQQQLLLDQQDFLYQRNEELPVKESSQGGQLQNIQNNIHQFDMELLQQQQQQQQRLNQHDLMDQLHEEPPVEESSQGGQLENFQNSIHQFDMVLLQKQQQQQRLDQQDLMDQLHDGLPVEESFHGGQLQNFQNTIHQFDQQQQENIMLQQQQQPQQQQQLLLDQQDFLYQRNEELPVKESSQGGQLQNIQNNIHQFDMDLLQQQQQQQRLDQQDLMDQLHDELPVEEPFHGGQLQNFQNNIYQFDQQQQENIMLQQQQQRQHQQQRLDQQDFLYQLNEELPVEESSQGGQLQNIQNSIHQFDMELLQQQQQQQKQQLYRQDFKSQLHDGLQVEESFHGGPLQNFQNNIHQFDQQQQERTLKELSQKQQKLQSNENNINNAIVSDGSTDSFSTNLFDNYAAQKPEFAVLNRDDPNGHGLAEAGVDGGSNSAEIHQPNLVYEDRYRFNRNDKLDNSNNVNVVGDNFVDQNANFDSGMIQSGNYNFGDEIGIHREIDHDYNHHVIGSSGAKYFQGGGSFPDGANDDMNSNDFLNGNNEVDNVQEVGVFPDEVNGEDNYNGLARGNNEVNNLHGGAFLNEVNDQINSGIISNEFAAKSLGFNNQGMNQQFDPVSDVQDTFISIENQKIDNPLGKNFDATRQQDNLFLSPEIMSNSDENLIEADANLIQITASQNFELVNKNDSRNIDQFRDTSFERQSIDPLNFYINQENFGPNVDKLGGSIEVDNDLPSVEYIRNTAGDFNGDEISPSNKEHDEHASPHTIVSEGDSGAGRVVQEQAGFSQDTSIPDEGDTQEQVHLLRGANLQFQDYQAGARSQTQGVAQQNFGVQDESIPREEIISQEQVLFRHEKSSQDETESREQYNYQQFDKIHDDADFYQGSGSSLEQAEPTEETISRQTNRLHDLEDFALDARSQEEARYQRDSKGQEKNYFLQQVKHHEQSNSQQVPNPMERAGFEDEADLKKLALEVKFLTEGRDYNVEEFQSHDQTEVEQDEGTESIQVSENPNRNQIDFEELMDKYEVAVGNTPESNSNAMATRSVPQNRGPRAKGRDMAADIDFSPSSEQAHASYIKENSILVGETETIGEQNDQDIGSSIQLAPTLVGNDIDVDVGIRDMRRAQNSRQEVGTFFKKSERVFDFQVKPSEPGTVMEQPVDMDAYKMSPFGGLDEGLAAGTEHTFQKSQQTNGITTKEGQHPESTGLEGHKIKRQGFPSVSEYYSSIREEPARNNMITLLQKRREQRQKLRQQQ